MRRNKVLAVVTAAALVVSSLAGAGSTAPNQEQSVKAAEYASAAEDNAVFDNYNASEITLNMGAGWNLGNQLEASNNGTPSETAWGNPKITQETLDMVKAAGFKTVRIPVSYLSKIGAAPDYTIDGTWLNRIKEVVDYAMNDGLYVIINMHGDGYNTVTGGWLLCNDTNNQETIKAKYKACWQQIAETFKAYDEHLIFESMNEEFDGIDSGSPNRDYYANINAYNQIFVDTVRQSGGNNAKRWLLIPGWNTNIDKTVGDYGFELPTDNYLSTEVASEEKRIMISVHYYDPYTFALGSATWYDSTKYITQWGDNVTDANKADNWGDKSYMEGQIKKLYNKFISKGYPVIIGEYGATDNSGKDSQNFSCRKDYYKCLCTYAKQYGCIPVAWDNHGLGKSGADQFGLFNRRTLQATDNGAEIIASIMSVYYEGGMEEVELAAAKAEAAKVISEAESKNQADYPAEKWSYFAQALAAAKEKAADSQATAEQIREATAALQEAMSNLTQTTQSPGPEGSQPPQSTSPEGSQPPASEAPQSTSPEGSQPPASSVPQSPGPEGSQAPGSSMEPTPTETPDSDADSVAGVKIKKVTSPKKATIKVTWKKAADVSGYAVKLGTNSKVTKSVKNVTIKQANKTSVTVKKCKRKKKYYVKIRAYVLKDGKKVYGKWSKTKKVKVK